MAHVMAGRGQGWQESPVASKQSWSLAPAIAVSSTGALSVLSMALAAMIQAPLTHDARTKVPNRTRPGGNDLDR